MDKVLTSYLGLVSNLPIANVVYAYDTSDGTVLYFEFNNSIYLGQKIQDSLLNNIQSKEVGVCVDKRPNIYYPNGVGCQ